MSPGFRAALDAYETAVEAVALGLVRVMAVALGRDAHDLAPGFVRPTTWLRLLRYPARPADAPPVPGSFVVNTGDRRLSTPHRVVNPSGAERYPVAYFFDPSFDTEVRPLTGAGDGPGFHFGDHVRSQLDATYSYRQDDI